MESIDCTYRSQASIPTEAATVFVSLELSRARWLVTSLSPKTSKISRHFIAGGNAAGLLRLLSELRAKAECHVNAAVKITCIQEIGFHGFWIHRVLAANGLESHVVEAASIAVPSAREDRRDRRRAIAAQLMAFKRGEPRVCAMVVVPTPEEEDRRRISRERKTMVKERIEHIDRIKWLMACQGIVNRRQLAAYAGLAPSPWRSGDLNKEQGISKSGNARLRTTMIEAAWLWLRH
jgi:transposase